MRGWVRRLRGGYPKEAPRETANDGTAPLSMPSDDEGASRGWLASELVVGKKEVYGTAKGREQTRRASARRRRHHVNNSRTSAARVSVKGARVTRSLVDEHARDQQRDIITARQNNTNDEDARRVPSPTVVSRKDTHPKALKHDRKLVMAKASLPTRNMAPSFSVEEDTTQFRSPCPKSTPVVGEGTLRRAKVSVVDTLAVPSPASSFSSSLPGRHVAGRTARYVQQQTYINKDPSAATNQNSPTRGPARVQRRTQASRTVRTSRAADDCASSRDNKLVPGSEVGSTLVQRQNGSEASSFPVAGPSDCESDRWVRRKSRTSAIISNSEAVGEPDVKSSVHHKTRVDTSPDYYWTTPEREPRHERTESAPPTALGVSRQAAVIGSGGYSKSPSSGGKWVHFRNDFSQHLVEGDRPTLFFLRPNESLAVTRVEGVGRLLVTVREEAGDDTVVLDGAVVHDSAACFGHGAKQTDYRFPYVAGHRYEFQVAPAQGVDFTTRDGDDRQMKMAQDYKSSAPSPKGLEIVFSVMAAYKQEDRLDDADALRFSLPALEAPRLTSKSRVETTHNVVKSPHFTTPLQSTLQSTIQNTIKNTIKNAFVARANTNNMNKINCPLPADDILVPPTEASKSPSPGKRWTMRETQAHIIKGSRSRRRPHHHPVAAETRRSSFGETGCESPRYPERGMQNSGFRASTGCESESGWANYQKRDENMKDVEDGGGNYLPLSPSRLDGTTARTRKHSALERRISSHYSPDKIRSVDGDTLRRTERIDRPRRWRLSRSVEDSPAGTVSLPSIRRSGDTSRQSAFARLETATDRTPTFVRQGSRQILPYDLAPTPARPRQEEEGRMARYHCRPTRGGYYRQVPDDRSTRTQPHTTPLYSRRDLDEGHRRAYPLMHTGEEDERCIPRNCDIECDQRISTPLEGRRQGRFIQYRRSRVQRDGYEADGCANDKKILRLHRRRSRVVEERIPRGEEDTELYAGGYCDIARDNRRYVGGTQAFYHPNKIASPRSEGYHNDDFILPGKSRWSGRAPSEPMRATRDLRGADPWGGRLRKADMSAVNEASPGYYSMQKMPHGERASEGRQWIN